MASILFLGTGFHKYDDAIIGELSSYSQVTYINLNKYKYDHPRLSSLMYRVGLKKYLKNKERDNVRKQLTLNKNTTYDILFVIRGDNLYDKELRILSEYQIPRKILYFWDGFDSHDNKEELISFFNDIYSFDYKDCAEYGFKKRPLFYINKQPNILYEKSIDISFVGLLHSNRLLWLRGLTRFAKENNLNVFFYASIGLPVLMFSLLRHKIYISDLNMLHTKVMPYSRYLSITEASKAVLDVQNSVQTGLTMRTIEAIAMGSKIITTNAYIREHEDIPNNSYLVLKNIEEQKEEVLDFLVSKEYFDIPERYSLAGFLKELGLIKE